MPSRQFLLHMALSLRNEAVFRANYEHANRVDQNVLIILREWAQYGAQSVIMPDTYAAALMVTDASAAITSQTRLPWPAFEIVLPQNLVISPTGPVQNVIVAQRPPDVAPKKRGVPHDYFCAYFEPGDASAVHTYATLADVVEPEALERNLGYYGGGPESEYDSEAELRVWQCIGRLIGGVALAIENARSEHPASYAARAPNVKRKSGGQVELRANVFKLGKPLKLDLRPQIREFVTGRSSGGGVPSVSTMVRGHWKKQAHGPGRTLRKNIAIAPYFRGEGPQLIRATKLNPGDDEGFEGIGFTDPRWEG